MARKSSKAAKKTTTTETLSNFTVGTVAFVAIFLLAYAALYTEAPMQTAIILLLAILGVIVAIFNITTQQEINFLIAVTALNVILISWHQLLGLPEMAKTFLTNLAIAFGAAGLVIALAVIIRLGSKP
ncbi:MAG TPA: hypothetical protein EYH56_02030 [Nanoarchaeota archaeon]|nr:hypothetical protein [Nanoarchaeota archaeon]